MDRFAWRKHIVPIAAFVLLMISASFAWKSVETSMSTGSAHVAHMEPSGQERADTARNHLAHLHGGGVPDCTGKGAICPMMGFCHPAMLVDVSLMADVVHDDDRIAIAIARGTGLNPSIVLPPPRQLHL